MDAFEYAATMAPQTLSVGQRLRKVAYRLRSTSSCDSGSASASVRGEASESSSSNVSDSDLEESTTDDAHSYEEDFHGQGSSTPRSRTWQADCCCQVTGMGVHDPASGYESRGSDISQNRGDKKRKTEARRWKPLPIRRLLPLPFYRMLTFSLGSLNLLVTVPIAYHDISLKRDSPVGVTLLWLIFDFLVFCPALVQARDFCRGRPKLNYFFALWAAWVPAVNIVLYRICIDNHGWAMGAVETPGHWHRCFPYFAYAWTCLVSVQHLHVPTERPSTLSQFMVCLAQWYIVVLIVANGESPMKQATSRRLYLTAVWSQVQAEAAHFLEDGDIQGLRALLVAMVFLQLTWSFAHVHFWQEGDCRSFLLGSIVLAIILHVATNDEERLFSKDPMYTKPEKAVSSQHSNRVSHVSSVKVAVGPIHKYLRSWRGANALYFLNGCMSLIVYILVGVRAQYKEEPGGVCFDFHRPQPCASHYIHCICGVCCLSMTVSVCNLLKEEALTTDRFKSYPLLKKWSRHLPMDRHLRVCTYCKIQLVWLKVMLFRFAIVGDSKNAFSMAIQLISITASSFLAARNALSVYGVVAGQADWEDKFRHPRVMWRMLQISLLVCLAMTAFTLEAHALISSKTQETISELFDIIAVVHTFPMLYYLGNEASLCISSQAWPEHSSPRGLRCLANFVALFMPMNVLGRILITGRSLRPFASLWGFQMSAEASLIGYGMLTLVVGNFVIAWAAGASN